MELKEDFQFIFFIPNYRKATEIWRRAGHANKTYNERLTTPGAMRTVFQLPLECFITSMTFHLHISLWLVLLIGPDHVSETEVERSQGSCQIPLSLAGNKTEIYT